MVVTNGMLLLAVVDLAIFGPLCAWLAQQKGRSVGEGFIVGAVLGLLGIIVIGMAPGRAVGPANLVPMASLRPCPRCAEPIQPAAVACRFCGADVAAIEPLPIPAPAALAAAPGMSKATKVLLLLVILALLALGWYLYAKAQTDAVLRSIPTFPR